LSIPIVRGIKYPNPGGKGRLGEEGKAREMTETVLDGIEGSERGGGRREGSVIMRWVAGTVPDEVEIWFRPR